MFEIRTRRQVYRMAAVITLFAVLIPVLTFALPFAFFGKAYFGFFAIAVFPAALIPLFLAPPIAIIILQMFRRQTLTIDKVDEYIRYDALTGVLTRTYLLGKSREQLAAGDGAFLMIDADHFKAINDTHGHDVGDEALKKLAEVLRKALTTEALIGRLGGEEFGVLLPGANHARAAMAAEAVCSLMRSEAGTIAGHEIGLTVSIGCAVHIPGQTLERIMKRADAALYQAKRTGRDRVCVAEAEVSVQDPEAVVADTAGKPARGGDRNNRRLTRQRPQPVAEQADQQNHLGQERQAETAAALPARRVLLDEVPGMQCPADGEDQPEPVRR
jgi:diguanylate cyclase (GGDEF)-like protein